MKNIEINLELIIVAIAEQFVHIYNGENPYSVCDNIINVIANNTNASNIKEYYKQQVEKAFKEKRK